MENHSTTPQAQASIFALNWNFSQPSQKPKKLVAYKKPIRFNPAHVPIAGDANAAVFLGQIAFWTEVMRSKRGDAWDGWFYKTADQWEAETGLTRSMQETARAKLVSRGLIIVSGKGQVCGKLSFRLNTDLLFRLEAQIGESVKPDSVDGQTGFSKSPKRIKPKPKPITENTKEISQKAQQHVAVASSISSNVSTPETDTSALIARLMNEANYTAADAAALIALGVTDERFTAQKIAFQLAHLLDRKPRDKAACLRDALNNERPAPHRQAREQKAKPEEVRGNTSAYVEWNTTPEKCAPKVEPAFLPSEADIVAANETRDPEHYNRPHAKRETGEGFAQLRALMNSMKQGTCTPTAPNDAAPKKVIERREPLVEARDALERHTPKVVETLGGSLAPHLSRVEWNAVVAAAQTEVTR